MRGRGISPPFCKRYHFDIFLPVKNISKNVFLADFFLIPGGGAYFQKNDQNQRFLRVSFENFL
jgi:hypothetical protein